MKYQGKTSELTALSLVLERDGFILCARLRLHDAQVGVCVGVCATYGNVDFRAVLRIRTVAV